MPLHVPTLQSVTVAIPVQVHITQVSCVAISVQVQITQQSLGLNVVEIFLGTLSSIMPT